MICVAHVTYTNEMLHAYTWVVSDMHGSLHTQNDLRCACYIYECAAAHVWMTRIEFTWLLAFTRWSACYIYACVCVGACVHVGVCGCMCGFTCACMSRGMRGFLKVGTWVCVNLCVLMCLCVVMCACVCVCVYTSMCVCMYVRIDFSCFYYWKQ